MKLEEAIILNVGSEVEAWLDDNVKKYWFKGGSRRFGYNKPDSDIDYFVFSLGRDMQNTLLENGFALPPACHEELYPAVSYTFRDIVHVVIIYNERSFINLREEHNHLEKIIDKTPRLRDVARSMSFFLKGVDVYRVLIAAFPMVER